MKHTKRRTTKLVKPSRKARSSLLGAPVMRSGRNATTCLEAAVEYLEMVQEIRKHEQKFLYADRNLGSLDLDFIVQNVLNYLR
jgi:hypothetical protein